VTLGTTCIFHFNLLESIELAPLVSYFEKMDVFHLYNLCVKICQWFFCWYYVLIGYKVPGQRSVWHRIYIDVIE
jgi:hypothetical protein